MKRRPWLKYLIAGAALCIIAAGTLMYLRWKNPKAVTGFIAPDGCDVIAVVNTHRFAEDVLLYGFKTVKDSQSIRKLYENTGVDMIQPFWVFGSSADTFAGAALKIGNRQKLDIFITQTLSARQVSDDKQHWTDGKKHFYIANDLVYVYFNGFRKPAAVPSALQTQYSNWFYSGLQDTLMRAAFSEGNSLTRKMGLPSEAGQLVVVNINNKLICTVKGIKLPACNIDTSAELSACFPQAWLTKSPVFGKVLGFIKKQDLDTQQLWANEGLLKLRLGGTRTISRSIVTYEFDEEFNRVEKRSVTSKTIPNIWLQWNVAGTKWLAREPADSIKRTDEAIRLSKSVFGLPCLLSVEENVLSLSTKGKSDGKVVKSATPGLLWCNMGAAQNLSKTLSWPWPWKEKTEISSFGILLHNNNLDFVIETKASNKKPAWLLLAEEFQSAIKL